MAENEKTDAEVAKLFYPNMENEAKRVDPLHYQGPEWDTLEIWGYDRFTNKRTGPEVVTYERIPMRLHDAVTRDVENWYGEEPFGEFQDLVSQLNEQGALDEKVSKSLKGLCEDAKKARRKEQKEEMAALIKKYLGEIRMGKRE